MIGLKEEKFKREGFEDRSDYRDTRSLRK